MPTLILGSKEGQDDHVRKDASHEDGHDSAILVAFSLLAVLNKRRKWEVLAGRGFDGGAGGRYQVAQLIGSTDNERPEASRAQLHKMNGNDAWDLDVSRCSIDDYKARVRYVPQAPCTIACSKKAAAMTRSLPMKQYG